ncbi:MAG: hypothetical protein ACR2NR_23195 [Solirubrobacteraceae bacterium]
MTVWLGAACVLFSVADLLLLGVGIARRSVLPALCGVGALALVVLALARGLTGAPGEATLVISVVTSVIGTILLWLGDAVWRLLDDAPEPNAAV